MHRHPQVPINRRLSRELILFFLLSYLIAWASWFPSFLHPSSFSLLSFVGLFAPAIAATIVSLVFEGKQGLTRLLRRLAMLRFAPLWYVVTLLLIPSLFFIVVAIGSGISKKPLAAYLLPASPFFVLLAFVWLMLINSGEEIGWRGFALPRLLNAINNPLLASLLLGALWALWHLPIYLVPGQSSIPLPLFLFFTIGLSVLYTVVFLQTSGSLLSVVLLHASTDIVPRILNMVAFTSFTWLWVSILTWVSAVGFYLIFRNRIAMAHSSLALPLQKGHLREPSQP